MSGSDDRTSTLYDALPVNDGVAAQVGPGCTLRLRPRGPLERDTCAELRYQLGAAFAAGITAVEIDLQDVTAIDPTGLGVLSGAARHLRSRDGVLSVTRPTSPVLKALRINGMIDLVLVAADEPLTGARR